MALFILQNYSDDVESPWGIRLGNLVIVA